MQSLVQYFFRKNTFPSGVAICSHPKKMSAASPRRGGLFGCLAMELLRSRHLAVEGR